MKFIIKDDQHIAHNQLQALYEDAQWYAYTNDLKLLQRACEQSLDVFSVWHDDTLQMGMDSSKWTIYKH